MAWIPNVTLAPVGGKICTNSARSHSSTLSKWWTMTRDFSISKWLAEGKRCVWYIVRKSVFERVGENRIREGLWRERQVLGGERKNRSRHVSNFFLERTYCAIHTYKDREKSLGIKFCCLAGIHWSRSSREASEIPRHRHGTPICHSLLKTAVSAAESRCAGRRSSLPC